MKIHVMRLLWSSLITSISVMFFLSSAMGAVLDNYQSTVPVAGYSSEDYNKALLPALVEVLAKVSANPDIATVPAIRSALEKPGKFVQSYRYSTANENGVKKLSLVVKFSPRLVDRLLQGSSQYVVSKGNPQTLIWLVAKNPNGKFDILYEEANPIVAALTASAKQEGVGLLWPMMDLQDISSVFSEQIQQLNENAVESASRRYAPDAILIGRVEQGPDGKWQGSWEWLKQGAAPKMWQTTGTDAPSAAVPVLSYLLGTAIRTSLFLASAAFNKDLI